MSAPKQLLAIAYKWLLAPPELGDFDVVLFLSSCRAKFGGAEAVTIDVPTTRTYHAKLPPKETRRELSDVSGTIGLLHPISDEYAMHKASAFERFVADCVLWLLAEQDFSAEKTIVLLQGPMLPKLRGRFLSRGLSERVSVYALTYQPEWFRRIEAAEQSYRGLKTANRCGVGGVYPPKALDKGTRSWVYRSLECSPYHFEVITNVWDCCRTDGEWLAQARAEVQELADPGFTETDKH